MSKQGRRILNSRNLHSEIAYRLAQRGITKGAEGSLYDVRYTRREQKGRRLVPWEKLLDEIILRSDQYGLDAVLESAFIEKHKSLLPQTLHCGR
jgi:hypothetical protein